MRKSLFRRAIIAAGLVLVSLLAACSIALKLGYHQGPTLLYWWMDGYVDFDDRQAPRVRQLVGLWFDWNRREQLPQLIRLLERAQVQVLEPAIAPQAFCALAEDVKHEVQAAYEQAVPSLAEVALTLTPQQTRTLEKRFAKNNAKFSDEFLPPRLEDRVKARTKKTRESFERIYGPLDDAQRERLLQLEATSPYDAERWLGERRLLQQEILQSLHELQGARAAGQTAPQLMAQAQAALRRIGEHAERSPREAYREQQQRVWDYNCALSAQMHASMSAAQRQRALQRLQGWQKDLRELVAERR